jgi:hypothetical protein
MTILGACEKDSNNNDNGINELMGRYSGTFTRTGMDTANVDFFFKDNNTFEGSSDTDKYPAICSGSFEINSSSIFVNDTCTWTANFDWTLIFDGTYSISFGENNAVRIWRNNGAVMDEYRLVRYSR